MRVNKLTLMLATLCCAHCTPARSAPTNISIAHSHGSPETTDWQWSTDDVDFRIDEMVWVNAAVELHVCEPDEWSLGDLIVAPLYAHVPSSGTRLGVPTVESFVSKQVGARVVGDLSPEPETFCRGYLVVAPADDDVMNLTDIATSDLLGSSFLLRGAYRSPASAEWTPFDLRSDETFVFEFPLRNPTTGADTIAVESGTNVLIEVGKNSIDFGSRIDSVDRVRDPMLVPELVNAIGESVEQRGKRSNDDD